jgi:thymidine kinase
LVDEAQFLQASQIDELFWFAVNGTIPVLAYGLRTDFATVGFPGASRLLELAHEIQELKTICRCGKKAMLNGRKINGTFVFSGNQVAIDGQDNVDYESLCGACYQKFRQASKAEGSLRPRVGYLE